MTVLAKTYEYFNKILTNEESFTTVMNRTVVSEGLPGEKIKIIRDTLKSTINKYYYIRFEVLCYLEDEPSENDLNVLILAQSMIHYVKGLNESIVMDYIKEDYKLLGLSLPLSSIEAVFNGLGEKPIPLPDKVAMILSKKISLSYSYPEWVIKMMIKHFGIKHTYKSVASSRRGIPLVVNFNPMKISKHVLEKDSRFNKTKFADTAFSYNGHDKIIGLDVFRDNKIFVEDEASQFLIELLEPKQGDDMLFLDDSKGVLALDATLRIGDYGNVQVACKDLLALNATKNMIRRFGLNSIRVFESDAKLLVTHVEYGTMDKVVVIPKSSQFGQIRKYPESLLTIRREDLDGIIENEKYCLEELSKFVKVGGVIVYAVFTLNNKEGQNIVSEFLENHEEFSMQEGRQIFPYEAPSDGFYYAKLKKIGLKK